MAHLAVTAGPAGLELVGQGAAWTDALDAVLPALPSCAPLVILVHGFRFDPAAHRHDPHRLLYAAQPGRASRKLISWPRALGFGGAGLEEGLSIGLGWSARAPLGRFADAYQRAGETGAALAALIEAIAARAPGRPVDILAHSLGARVALCALPRLSDAGGAALGRLILLGGAEFAGRAEAACASAPATARPEVYSITARANDVYDALFEAAAPGGPGADHALARGLPRVRNWMTLQIDSPGMRLFARSRGVALAAPDRRICHWGFYTLPGAMTLYARILRDRPIWSVAALRGAPALMEQEPRWSRLGPLPRLPGAGSLTLPGRRARGT